MRDSTIRFQDIDGFGFHAVGHDGLLGERSYVLCNTARDAFIVAAALDDLQSQLLATTTIWGSNLDKPQKDESRIRIQRLADDFGAPLGIRAYGGEVL